MKPRALLVDDDEKALAPLGEVVRRHGFVPRFAKTLREARQRLRREEAEVVLLDLLLPDGNGLELLDDLPAGHRPEVILMTGEPSVGSAVTALRRRSVRDYLTKPLDVERLHAHLMSLGRSATSASERGADATVLGESGPIREIRRRISQVAPTEATVLVFGESGTGKELVAESIHRESQRISKPFVAINCGAIPENLIESELFGHEKGAFTGATKSRKGVFERADKGTLFLDEIAEMPLDLQVRLLRVLETGVLWRVGGDREVTVDVRVIAATNQVPTQAVESGKLREDLLYRLSVFPIRVPPLRDRREDISLLACHFLAQLNEAEGSEKKFAPETLEALRLYDWPGNVRQLRNHVHHAFILTSGQIRVEDLPPSLTDAGASGERTVSPAANGSATIEIPIGASIAEAERRLIEATLEHYGGDKKLTAKTLSISLKTLYNRLNAYREEDSAPEREATG